MSQDFRPAEACARRRAVRIVDGPEEMHRNTPAELEPAKRAAPHEPEIQDARLPTRNPAHSSYARRMGGPMARNRQNCLQRNRPP
jgi:hypothetical protein